MSVRRFYQEIDGRKLFGLVADSEKELEAWLSLQGLSLGGAAPATSVDCVRPPGRPSRSEEIRAAIEILGVRLIGAGKARARARLIQRQIAKMAGCTVPAIRTIEDYLLAHPEPANLHARGKWRGNSDSAKLTDERKARCSKRSSRA